MGFDLTGAGTAARRRRGAAAAVGLSVAAHLLLAPLLGRASGPAAAGPDAAPPEPMLIDLTPPPPDPAPPAAEAGAAGAAVPVEGAAAAAPDPVPAPPRPSPPRARPTPPPPRPVEPLPVAPAPAAAPIVAWTTVGEAELAGALRAGAGAGRGPGAAGGDAAGRGGPCDMVGRLERALRDDPGVRAAAARAGAGRGRALVVWDGDWLTHPGEAGKGLAGVRQAIAVEVAFAPADCRGATVRGWAVVALAEGPDAPRLALGPGTWRWSDLTGAR